MAFPSRKRGLRSITVNERMFRWRLKTGVPDSLLVVYSSSSGTPLRVVLVGWKDFWAVFPFYAPNSPERIEPSFVQKAIEFGLVHGWAPDSKGAAFQIEWRDEQLQMPTGASGHHPEDSRSISSA